MLRQPLVVVMGNVDAGKCVHPSTKIHLSNGEVSTIESLWHKLTSSGYMVKKDKDGFNVSTNLDIYSLNLESKQQEKHPLFQVCKLQSPKELVLVENSLGQEIRVTKEHPFFIFNGEKIIECSAMDLEEGNFVLCPKIIKRSPLTFAQVRNEIIEKLLEKESFLFRLSKKKNEEIEKLLRKNKIYSQYAYKVRKNLYRIEDIREFKTLTKEILAVKSSSRKQRVGHSSNWVTIPSNKEGLLQFFQLVGFIYGDGTAKSLSITNIDSEVQNKVIEIFTNVLDVDAKLVSNMRKTDYIHNSGGKTFQRLLETCFNFPSKKKSNNLSIPNILFKSDKELIGHFLGGYFDTDGYFAASKGIVELSSASKKIYNELPILLSYLGFGCNKFSKVNKKHQKEYYYISISGKEELKKIRSFCPLVIKYKSNNLDFMISKAVSNKKLDLFPITKESLKNIRVNLALSQNEIPVKYWGKYESKQNITKDIFRKFIDFCDKSRAEIRTKIENKQACLSLGSVQELYSLTDSNFKTYNKLRELQADELIYKSNKKIILTKKGKSLLNFWSNFNPDKVINQLLTLKPLLNTEVHFVQIQKKKIIKSDTEWVYDLSEPHNENFFANGFLVHNTRTLDTIRRTAIVDSEAGGITQMISSSAISLKTLQNVCGDLLKGKSTALPGLVFIDTPGHAAFSNMRKRGGNLADIAILVVDINEGIKQQTIECINILKSYKTPFVIALNKIDLVPGWVDVEDKYILGRVGKQSERIQQLIEKRLYEIVGKLHELGIQAERFDRIDDYTKSIAMVPCSGKFGPGIPELLMVLLGLAQKFLEQNLQTDLEGPARGTVLEVADEKGLGTTVNVIIYEGKIKVNDRIIIGGLGEPIVTKVKGLFEPDEKNKYKSVKEVIAAAGVKIAANDVKDVVSGMPLFVINNDEEELRKKIQEEVEEVIIETEASGVVIKADSLGSLEAVIGMLRDKDIPIKKASVGPITKKDLTSAVSDENDLNKVILCFNIPSEGQKEVKVISHNIIYQLIEDLEKWREEQRKAEEERELQGLVRPVKVIYLMGCTFRQNNPAVVGVEILGGTLRPDYDIMKINGDTVGNIKTIQLEKDSVKRAEKGKQVAISLPGVTAGRQIREGEIFYTDMNQQNFRRLKELKRLLTPEEIQILKEIAEIKRKEDHLWGI